MSEFKIIAKTLHNLEDVLSQEIEALGGRELEVGKRMVSFVGNQELLYRANLRLRTALRILKPLYTFRANDPDTLYEKLRAFAWDKVMAPQQTFAIDTTVYSDKFSHSKYVGYRTKDAIVDYWRDKAGTRPNVSLNNPNLYINIHIAHEEVTLSLDSSGESLHKRGYRVVQTDAPINEVLAAGILLKAGWQGETDLIDPMCGSGTFLIEAALIARNIAPGLYRKNFAFEQWLDFDSKLFEQVYNDDSAERPFEHHIYGSDILPNAIEVAKRNIARAGLSKDISLEAISFQNRPQPTQPSLIVMNPPYGERLKLTSPEELYTMIGERLKHNYTGSTAWVIAYRPEHFHGIGLKDTLHIDLKNGALDCELRGYELFSGKHKEHKARGGADKKPSQTTSSRKGESATRSQVLERRVKSSRDAHSSPKWREEYKGKNSRFIQAKESKAPRDNATSAKEQKVTKPSKRLWPQERFRSSDEDRGRTRKPSRKAMHFQVFKDEPSDNS